MFARRTHRTRWVEVALSDYVFSELIKFPTLDEDTPRLTGNKGLFSSISKFNFPNCGDQRCAIPCTTVPVEQITQCSDLLPASPLHCLDSPRRVLWQAVYRQVGRELLQSVDPNSLSFLRSK